MDRTTILLLAVEMVKGMGFKCFYPRYTIHRKEPTYCFITDGTNIGYMQSNDLGNAMCFSTIHKPNRKHGESFGIADNVPLDKITKGLIERTFFGVSLRINTKDISKYKSWEDFITNSLTAKICEEMVEL